jgi:hypothetical protein
MEVELWDGTIRKGENHDNKALSDASATVLNSGTALSPRRALALLEFEAGQVSHAGEQGVIHMTRDVYSLLTSVGDVFMYDEDEKRVKTLNGTPVVVGSGYSGTGPDEAANNTASVTNKWMYATGSVKTYLGDVDVVLGVLERFFGSQLGFIGLLLVQVLAAHGGVPRAAQPAQ